MECTLQLFSIFHSIVELDNQSTDTTRHDSLFNDSQWFNSNAVEFGMSSNSDANGDLLRLNFTMISSIYNLWIIWGNIVNEIYKQDIARNCCTEMKSPLMACIVIQDHIQYVFQQKTKISIKNKTQICSFFLLFFLLGNYSIHNDIV